MLGVSTSGYYAWRRRPPSRRALSREIAQIHEQSRGTYGARRVTTTRRDPQATVAADQVRREFHAEEPNRLWVADITYVPTAEGFVYLATVLDVFSRKVVGWAMSARQTAALVSSALAMAVDTRAPRAVVLHSDRGCQYTALAFTRSCEQARSEIFRFLEGFYNLRRRHLALGYRSPAEFERRWHEQREPVRL